MATQRPTRRRRISPLAIFLTLFVSAFVLYGVFAALAVAVGGYRELGAELSTDKIGVITVSGIISAEGEASMFGGPVAGGAVETIKHIRAAARDDTIRAVVIRINSPGGSAAASQEIYEAILAARKRKPFIASMADVAASGGYYIAAACNQIVASPATMTGSIGVIMPGYDASGLLAWLRVKPETIKSGRFKDIGSMGRPMSAAERELLQTMVSGVYEQFLTDVAAGRNRKVELIRPYADGRILTGAQAQQAGLVDQLGGYYDAIHLAQAKAGIKADPEAEPNLETYGSGTLLEQLLGARADRRLRLGGFSLPLPWPGPAAPAASAPSVAGGPPAAFSSAVAPPLWLLAPWAAPLGG